MHTRFEMSALTAQLALIAIKGEVDIESAPELLGHIEDALTQAQSVAVCFRDCTYLDSSVVNVLVKMHKIAVARRLRVVVVANPGSGPHRIFEVAGLRHLMPLAESLEKAALA